MPNFCGLPKKTLQKNWRLIYSDGYMRAGNGLASSPQSRGVTVCRWHSHNRPLLLLLLTEIAPPIGTCLRQEPTGVASRTKGKRKSADYRLPPFSFDSRFSTDRGSSKTTPTARDFTPVKPQPVVVELRPVIARVAHVTQMRSAASVPTSASCHYSQARTGFPNPL